MGTYKIKSIFNKRKSEPKIGIVLSGGAVRCIAHLGVIKALQANGVYPVMISGVSAGAIAGAFYAEEIEPDEILDFFLHRKLMSFISLRFNKGLAGMKKLREELEDLLKSKDFGDLKKKLFVSTTNLNTAKTETFYQGSLIDKIVASSSIPIVFEPVEIDGQLHVDGGLMNNMPIEPLIGKCDKIIGVNVNPIGYKKEFRNLLSIGERAFHLGIMANYISKTNRFDVFIQPDKLKDYGLFDLNQGKDIYNIGYEYTMKLFQDNKIKL